MQERMSPQRFSLSWGNWRDCLRQWPWEAEVTAGGGPKDWKRAMILKRLLVFSGTLAALGLLGVASYQVRQLMAALVLFSAGFGALFVIAAGLVAVHSGTVGVTSWLRIRAPKWNRAGREWRFVFSHFLEGRRLWPRRAHRVPAPVVPSAGSL
jgi:hypothetical protein